MNKHHNTGNQYAAKSDDERRDAQIQIRVKQSEKDLFKSEAASENKSMSQWIVEQCLKTLNKTSGRKF